MNGPVIGGFAPNKAVTQDDWKLMQLAGIRGVLLMAANHAPGDVDAARSYLGDDVDMLVRLPDATSTGVIAGAAGWAARCAAYVRAFYAKGVRRFQLDNEPSLQTGRDGRGAWAANGGAAGYQQFLSEAIGYLRGLIADLAGVQLGAPQLTPAMLGADGKLLTNADGSPRDTLAEWMKALGWKAVGQFDFICCPCYWQGFANIGHGEYGRNYKRFHDWQPAKPIEVTECGTYRPELDELPRYRTMIEQYPAFIRQVQREAAQHKVRAVRFFFVGKPTDDWRVYEIDGGVATAMRVAIA